MKKSAHRAIVIAAMLAATAASAQDSYVGLSATTSGKVKATFSTGQVTENFNDPNSWKLYGGYNLTDRFGFEAGVLNSGTYKIGIPSNLGGGETQFKSRTMYAAATARAPLTEDLSIFGKAGVAHHRVSAVSTVAGLSMKESSFRPMLGVGLDYKIGKNVSAALELNHYGSADGFKHRKLEAGLKYAF
jgi:OOP family OmpA-OmpF porin